MKLEKRVRYLKMSNAEGLLVLLAIFYRDFCKKNKIVFVVTLFVIFPLGIYLFGELQKILITTFILNK